MTELVYQRSWPEKDTYTGWAHLGYVNLTTLRTGLPGEEGFYQWIANTVVEITVNAKGGRMLNVKIYREPSQWGIIPTYNWRLEFLFYTTALALPAIIVAAIAALLFGIALWIGTQGVRNLYIRKPGEEPIIPDWMLGVVIIGIFGLVGYFLVTQRETVTRGIRAVGRPIARRVEAM